MPFRHKTAKKVQVLLAQSVLRHLATRLCPARPGGFYWNYLETAESMRPPACKAAGHRQYQPSLAHQWSGRATWRAAFGAFGLAEGTARCLLRELCQGIACSRPVSETTSRATLKIMPGATSSTTSSFLFLVAMPFVTSRFMSLLATSSYDAKPLDLWTLNFNAALHQGGHSAGRLSCRRRHS